MQSLHSETPFSLNRRRAVARTARTARPAAQPGPSAADCPRPRCRGRRSREPRIEVLEFASTPEVWIPAWLFQPGQGEASKAIDHRPRTGAAVPAWHEGELYDRSGAEQGYAVCAPDLRGIGDSTPEFGRAAARHARPHNSDEHWAWGSLILGKPLAGQRVTDILAIVQGLRGAAGAERQAAVHRGAWFLTVPALFAAALEPAIGGLYLAGGLVSFADIVATEDYKQPFGNFVPNLLLTRTCQTWRRRSLRAVLCLAVASMAPDSVSLPTECASSTARIHTFRSSRMRLGCARHSPRAAAVIITAVFIDLLFDAAFDAIREISHRL